MSSEGKDLGALPENARLWVFVLERPLGQTERQLLETRLDDFIGSWKSHGADVFGAYEIRYNKFLLVGADESYCSVSGCSIDSLNRGVRSLLSDTALALSDIANVCFLHDGTIKEVSRAAFKDLVKTGEVSPDTQVFNNAVTTIGQLQHGEWELPARASWHNAAFFGV